jgi:DNA polymerase elongation subunit (family B)
MSQPLRAGTIQNWKLIDGIMTETIQEEISGSSPVPSIYETEVETFDVVNAGPRSRYMIRTAIGPMIVHNSGFGMGVDKFVDYCATFGIIMPRSSEDPNEVTAERCIYGFREKYAEIPVYWKALENAVKSAVREHRCIYVKGVVVDGRNTKCLRIKLPSGRYIHYFNPKIGKKKKFGKMMETVSYTAFDAKGSQEKDLYGGLICENIVQAVARDILLNGMLEAEKMGFRIIMTIHDEIVAEVPLDSPLGEAQLLACMTKTPEWAEGMGFILGAEGYENPFYKK